MIDYKNHVPYWNARYVSFSEIQEANPKQLGFYKVFKKHFLNSKYIDIKGNDTYAFVLFYDLIENHNLETKELTNLLQNLVKYYPKTKSWVEPVIIEKIENSDDFEKAWDIILQYGYTSVPKIIEYENKLNRELLNGELIVKLGGYSHLTTFGQKNIDKIKPFADKQLEKYKIEKGTKFFDIFLKDGKPIYEYNSPYFEEFFLSKAEYEHYKAIDDNQGKSGHVNLFPHVVANSIYNQCRFILKKAEDLYREKIGMPKVGEGWISETELFYKISNYFENEEVVHHASPKWLNRQHLDIYFPKLNIGIEYQGAQHYEPVGFFGGQEAFVKTVERDMKKKKLCEKHNCTLIYAKEGYVLNEIVKKIENRKRCTTHLHRLG